MVVEGGDQLPATRADGHMELLPRRCTSRARELLGSFLPEHNSDMSLRTRASSVPPLGQLSLDAGNDVRQSCYIRIRVVSPRKRVATYVLQFRMCPCVFQFEDFHVYGPAALPPAPAAELRSRWIPPTTPAPQPPCSALHRLQHRRPTAAPRRNARPPAPRRPLSCTRA